MSSQFWGRVQAWFCQQFTAPRLYSAQGKAKAGFSSGLTLRGVDSTQFFTAVMLRAWLPPRLSSRSPPPFLVTATTSQPSTKHGSCFSSGWTWESNQGQLWRKPEWSCSLISERKSHYFYFTQWGRGKFLHPAHTQEIGDHWGILKDACYNLTKTKLTKIRALLFINQQS